MSNVENVVKDFLTDDEKKKWDCKINPKMENGKLIAFTMNCELKEEKKCPPCPPCSETLHKTQIEENPSIYPTESQQKVSWIEQRKIKKDVEKKLEDMKKEMEKQSKESAENREKHQKDSMKKQYLTPSDEK